MRKFSSIALALPVALAMAAPASANLFWDFNTSWTFDGTTYSLSGQTAPGQDQVGQLYDIHQSLTFGIGGNTFDYVGYSGPQGFADGTCCFTRPDPPVVNVTFDGSGGFTFNNNFTWTADGPWASDGSVQAYTLTSNGGTFYINSAVAGPNPNDLVPSNSSPDSGGVTQNTSAALVPEINGSGFAYIAFILGALGLWLYSGAGRGRVEEEAVAT